MANKSGKGFLLNTNFHKSANNAALSAPDKQKPDGKSSIQPEGTAIKKQYNTETKRITTRKVYAKKIHAKLLDPGEDRMLATTKHLHYSIKRAIDVCKD